MKDIKKLHAIVEGAGGAGVTFSYAKVSELITDIQNHINNILDRCSQEITVSSYSGMASDALNASIDAFTKNLSTEVQEPLNIMKQDIQTAYNAYEETEAELKTDLESIAASIKNTIN